MGKQLRKNRWVDEQNTKKPDSSKTSPFLRQTEKERWMGSKGISKLWKILLTDFIAPWRKVKSERALEVLQQSWTALKHLGRWPTVPTPLIGVISHSKSLKSEVCILMFIMDVLTKTAFFFFSPSTKNGHENETSFPHQHLIQGAWLDLLWVLFVKA